MCAAVFNICFFVYLLVGWIVCLFVVVVCLKCALLLGCISVFVCACVIVCMFVYIFICPFFCISFALFVPLTSLCDDTPRGRTSIPGQSSGSAAFPHRTREHFRSVFFFCFLFSPTGIVLFLICCLIHCNLWIILYVCYSLAIVPPDLVLFVAVCSTPFPFRYHFLRRVVVIASNLQYAFELIARVSQR